MAEQDLQKENKQLKNEIKIITRAIVFMAKSIKSVVHETPHRKVKQKLKGILQMADKIYRNENGIY